MNRLKAASNSPHFFSVISWGVTALIVLSLVGVAFWKLRPAPVPAETQAAPTQTGDVPSLPSTSTGDQFSAPIHRRADIKTIIPDRQTYSVTEYTVSRGDSLFGIADEYKIKPETLYWANPDVFLGSPDSLKPGDVLLVPPVDGVYYEWQKGDTFESVATAFEVDPAVILDWPGNNIDLTDPKVTVGESVLIPGAERNDQPLFIQTITVANTAAGAACGGGFVGRGYFTWPTNSHSLSGFNFGEGGSHRGIDISAQVGSPIYAADNGVVTMASLDEWNNGYGHVIQIDHGNGFVTLYAHLTDIFVAPCTAVLAGSQIATAGSTGNSSGAHLHFEIRYGGSAVNPWDYLP
jgi:murein DD-endopeptidase MepM/ murein hydrolase activator NlpD